MTWMLVVLFTFTWRNRIGYPAQPGLIHPSICLSVCLSVYTYQQIRYSAENGTSPTDLVIYSSKSWIYDVNCESEILRKKYICESNTVNNMKLMILEKIRVLRTCSSSPRAASVIVSPGQPCRGVHQDSPMRKIYNRVMGLARFKCFH